MSSHEDFAHQKGGGAGMRQEKEGDGEEGADEGGKCAQSSRRANTTQRPQTGEGCGIIHRILSGGRLTRLDMAALFGALVYCTFPIDLVPDDIGAIGYLDDMAVIVGILAYLQRKPESE